MLRRTCEENVSQLYVQHQGFKEGGVCANLKLHRKQPNHQIRRDKEGQITGLRLSVAAAGAADVVMVMNLSGSSKLKPWSSKAGIYLI